MKHIPLPSLLSGRKKDDSAQPHAARQALTQATSQGQQRFVRVTSGNTKGQAIMHKVALGVIGLCLLAGPASCVANGRSGATPSRTTPTAPTITGQVQANAQAVSFVRQWMITTEETSDNLYAQMAVAPEQATFPKTSPAAPTLVEVAASQPGAREGLWSVVVHAAGGSAGAGEWYSVPVRVQHVEGVWRTGVMGLPGRTSRPALVVRQASSGLVAVASSNPAVVTAGGFLTSWLGGEASVDRWAVPGFSAAPVGGRPCSSVRLLSAASSQEGAEVLSAASRPELSDPVAAGAREEPSSATSPGAAEVVVQVVATCVTDGLSRPVQYDLTLTQSNGQWAVKALN